MSERRRRTEYAPRKVESSVSREKFEAYMAARKEALRKEAEEANKDSES